MIKHNIVLYTLVFLLVIIHANNQFAHAASNNCTIIEEEIIPLLPPNLEQVAIWTKTVGVSGEDKPRALLGVADGGQIAIGESRAYDEKTAFADRQIEMIRTDKNGKIVLNKWIPIKNLQSVNDAILLKDKIVVLTQINNEMNLQFLNGIGEKLGTIVLHDSERNLIPKAMIMQGGKLIIAAISINKSNKDDYNTVLFWTDKDGKQILKRAYLPGVQNKPEYVGRGYGDDLLVTGRIVGDNGREVGWLMRLDKKGDIIFQRPYARGADSVIRTAISYDDNSIITIGDAMPNTGDKSAWIMNVKGDGNIIWQKYIKGKYIYTGVDVVVAKDGRINALLAGKPSTFGGREHARIITISDIGQIIDDEAYIEGTNSIPLRLINQNDGRYLLGMAQTSVSKHAKEEGAEYIVYDTWLMGLPALKPYQNPCAKAPDRTLDILP